MIQKHGKLQSCMKETSVNFYFFALNVVFFFLTLCDLNILPYFIIKVNIKIVCFEKIVHCDGFFDTLFLRLIYLKTMLKKIETCVIIETMKNVYIGERYEKL